jgi:hypothetical protein
LPILGRETGSFLERAAELRDLARSMQRDSARIEISIYACPAEEDLVRRHADAGITRAIFALPAAPGEAVLPLLDRYASIGKKCG